MLSLEDFYEHDTNLRNDILSLEQEIVLLDTILALKESGIGLESAMPTLVASVNMANIGTTGSVSEEVLKRYYNLSTEDYKTVFSEINNKISLVFKNTVDTLTALLTWWTTHSVEIKELSIIASKMKTDVTITVPNGKYLRYNNKTVSNFKEYVKAFSEMSSYMVTVNKELDKFTKDDLFSSIKALFSVFTGYNDYFRKNYERLDSLTANILKNGKYITSEVDLVHYHHSPSLLGSSSIFVCTPIKKETDISKMKLQTGTFRVWVKRDEKFEFGSNDMIELTIDSKSLNELAKLCDELVKSYLPMLALKNKFSTLGALDISKDFFKTNCY